MTATDAARCFSEVLNRVAAGEEIEVTRSEAPVAVIGLGQPGLELAQVGDVLVEIEADPGEVAAPREDLARHILQRGYRAVMGPRDEVVPHDPGGAPREAGGQGFRRPGSGMPSGSFPLRTNGR